MRFTKQHKVIINSMNKIEACAFVKFLHSEILRHALDIEEASELIDLVKKRYKL